MKILIVSAHPDDEVLGAGGTVARHVAEGDEVHWCVVTQAYTPPWPEGYEKTARGQAEGVRGCLGMASVTFLGFPTVKLNTVPYMELSGAIQKVVGEVCPEVMYLPPAADINQDHRIVHDCSLVAARPLPDSPVKSVFGYELPFSARYGAPSGLVPPPATWFVDITDFLDRKIEAMRIYQSEVKELPHPRSLEGIRLCAQERGLTVGCKAAEAFTVVRSLR